jgi:hypothetical protein
LLKRRPVLHIRYALLGVSQQADFDEIGEAAKWTVIDGKRKVAADPEVLSHG